MGHVKDISRFINLGIPLNFAVLPQEPYSTSIAKELNSRKIPFIMHLPMEPEGYPEKNPGAHALLVNMNKKGIKRKFYENLKSVPGAVGINNHMGSKFTADKKQMDLLLRIVKHEDMFFLDSTTTPDSKAKTIAKKLGARCIENKIFLDFEDSAEHTRKKFDKLLRLVKKKWIKYSYRTHSKKTFPSSSKGIHTYLQIRRYKICILKRVIR